jgi:hypothetical protein
MKLIKSIVRPNKVDDVKEALAKLSIAGMTVTEVRGHGKQKGHTQRDNGDCRIGFDRNAGAPPIGEPIDPGGPAYERKQTSQRGVHGSADAYISAHIDD